MNEKASGRMRTSAYNGDIASDRRRRESLSRQTLFYKKTKNIVDKLDISVLYLKMHYCGKLCHDIA